MALFRVMGRRGPLGRKLRRGFAACAAAWLGCAACAPHASGEAPGAVRAAATVNGSTITLGELRRAYHRRALSRDGAGGVGSAADALLLHTTLADLVERRLLTLAARAHHQAVFSAEVDAAWRLLTARWEPGALTETLTQLRLSPLAIKEDLREALLAQKYLRTMVQDRVAVLDADIEQYLSRHPEVMAQPEQVRLRHMVLPDEAAAKSVLERLRKGETFAALAVARSLAADAPSGGDMGLLQHDQLPASTADVVFRLPVRKVSAPMTLCDGVHLFFVSERLPKHALSVAQSRPRAEAVLRREAESLALAAHMAQLKQAATVVTHEVTLEDVL